MEIDALARIIQTISIGMGVMLCLAAMFQLKRYGEMRTYMSTQMTLGGPLMTMLAGVMFMMLPTMVGTILLAIYGTASPLRYVSDGNVGGFQHLVDYVVKFVRIAGVISIMRGIMLLSRAGGGQGGQQGVAGRAVIHMVGGAMLVNIVQTAALVQGLIQGGSA